MFFQAETTLAELSKMDRRKYHQRFRKLLDNACRGAYGALMQCAANNNFEEFSNNYVPDALVVDADENHAMHYFAYHGNVPALEWLLTVLGIDINILNKIDKTPLWFAGLGGEVWLTDTAPHVDAMRYLCDGDGHGLLSASEIIRIMADIKKLLDQQSFVTVDFPFDENIEEGICNGVSKMATAYSVAATGRAFNENFIRMCTFPCLEEAILQALYRKAAEDAEELQIMEFLRGIIHYQAPDQHHQSRYGTPFRQDDFSKIYARVYPLALPQVGKIDICYARPFILTPEQMEIFCDRLRTRFMRPDLAGQPFSFLAASEEHIIQFSIAPVEEQACWIVNTESAQKVQWRNMAEKLCEILEDAYAIDAECTGFNFFIVAAEAQAPLIKPREFDQFFEGHCPFATMIHQETASGATLAHFCAELARGSRDFPHLQRLRPEILNKPDCNGRTPALVAIDYSNSGVLDWLLENVVGINIAILRAQAIEDENMLAIMAIDRFLAEQLAGDDESDMELDEEEDEGNDMDLNAADDEANDDNDMEADGADSNADDENDVESEGNDDNAHDENDAQPEGNDYDADDENNMESEEAEAAASYTRR